MSERELTAEELFLLWAIVGQDIANLYHDTGHLTKAIVQRDDLRSKLERMWKAKREQEEREGESK